MSSLGLAPPGVSGYGGALDYTRRFLGGLVQEQESFPLVGTTIINFLPLNADRVGLLIVNLGASSTFVSINSSVSSSQGIILLANGGSFSANVTEDFTLTSRGFWGVTTVGSNALYVLEIIRILQPAQVTSR
jgi:hypothetical protein